MYSLCETTDNSQFGITEKHFYKDVRKASIHISGGSNFYILRRSKVIDIIIKD